jgi:hypothetical protein
VVFAAILCGFRARCALEIDDGSQTRIDKIFSMIEECRYGIHDLSRGPSSTRPPACLGSTCRSNSGCFSASSGVARVGSGARRALCSTLSSIGIRSLISDIAGQDIQAHAGDVGRAIRAVRDWLRTCSGRKLPGAAEVCRRYRMFEDALPQICVRAEVDASELTFADFSSLAAEWLKVALPATPL